jgi:hypothetical protein
MATSSRSGPACPVCTLPLEEHEQLYLGVLDTAAGKTAVVLVSPSDGDTLCLGLAIGSKKSIVAGLAGSRTAPSSKKG